MPAWLTRGHDPALRAVAAMVAGGPPQAIVLAGPAGVGKTTLAADLAAGLLCDAADPAERPCRACRGCRLVDNGNHPDVHRLEPSGPGDQIRIGDRASPLPGTVRRLVADLALLPVEGGARVAIVERAHRMNDDAQAAMLKTLEEPPPGVTIVLCTDEEDRLLPTVRSRCARVRLGPVAVRDIEAMLSEGGLADPPLAARLARLAQGRPGVAHALALAPEAVAARTEIARTLLDLLASRPGRRLAIGRELLARAADAAATVDGRTEPPPAAQPAADTPAAGGEGGDDDEAAGGTRQPAAARRRAAAALIGIWRDLVRDLALVAAGEERTLRDPAMLDDLRAAAAAISPVSVAPFMARLDAAGELVAANVVPELIIDSLVLGWPTGAGRHQDLPRGSAA